MSKPGGPFLREPAVFFVRGSLLNLLRKAAGSQATKDELIRKTGKTSAAVARLMAWMVKEGKIVRVEPDVFALPQPGAAEKPYRPARKLILDALITAPGNEATTAEPVSATGRNRSAIDVALFRLTKAVRSPAASPATLPWARRRGRREASHGGAAHRNPWVAAMGRGGRAGEAGAKPPHAPGAH